ncbi:MAG: carboxymuconolactone decarboxylase family protein [Candidatus Berkiella sp.]
MTITPKELEMIDPAFKLMSEFSKLSQGTSSHVHMMRQEAIFCDGIFPAKFKALAAAIWGISARCEPCLKFYILKAKELGATEKEVGEILAVASAMGGCVGEMWALKAYKAFKDKGASEEECCKI